MCLVILGNNDCMAMDIFNAVSKEYHETNNKQSKAENLRFIIMYLDKKELISGIRCKDVRDFLKKRMNTFFTLEGLEQSLYDTSQYYKKSLCLSKTKAKQLIRELQKRGLIEKREDGSNGYEDIFSTTVKGNAFCVAKFLKPLRKKDAKVLLDSLLERISEINGNESFLYSVNYVGLFGSLAAGASQVNDIDLIVELKPKFSDDKIEELQKEIEEKENRVSKRSWFESMFAPEDRVYKFLKNRNPYINIMTPSNVQCLSLTKESVITLFSAEQLLPPNEEIT